MRSTAPTRLKATTNSQNSGRILVVSSAAIARAAPGHVGGTFTTSREPAARAGVDAENAVVLVVRAVEKNPQLHRLQLLEKDFQIALQLELESVGEKPGRGEDDGEDRQDARIDQRQKPGEISDQ